MFVFYLSMQITSQKDNTHFASIRLGTTNLFKIKNGKKAGFEKVFITMLDDKDAKDVEVIKKLKKLWVENSSKLPRSPHDEAYLSQRETEGLCDNFIELSESSPEEKFLGSLSENFYKRVFLVIEQPGNFSLEKRILGFTKMREHVEKPEAMEWSYLVVNPLFSSANKKRTFGGIGETLFAKALQIAKQNGFKKVEWMSDNDPYYKYLLNQINVNIKDITEGDVWSVLALPKKFFDTFLTHFDKKYGTNFASSGLEKEIPSFNRRV